MERPVPIVVEQDVVVGFVGCYKAGNWGLQIAKPMGKRYC